MGKTVFKIAEKIAPHLSDAQWEMIEGINRYYDQESLAKYYKKVMRWERCSYDEAVKLCETNVTYRLGKKTCSPAIMEMLKIEDCSGI